MGLSLVPRIKPFLGWKEIKSALFPSKNAVCEFERAFSSKFNAKEGIMFSHGRVGLFSFFRAMEIENKEVICPAYTCVVVAHSVVLSGNKPVFIDCEKDSPNMSLSMLEEAITNETRAVIVTHLFGFPMQVHEVNRIIRNAEQKFGTKIYVIQDVAHSFGCKIQGDFVSQHGDIAFYGLNISKIITSTFGGIITTDSEIIASKLKSFRDENFKERSVFGRVFKVIYSIKTFGYPS